MNDDLTVSKSAASSDLATFLHDRRYAKYGRLVFAVLGAIPWIGGLISVAVIFLGIGSVVASRAAGLVKGKDGGTPVSGDPYRTIST